MITNMHKFREKLSAGKLCLGPSITFSDPTVTESLAPSVDFVWIDLEHNPTDMQSLLSHLIAARAGGAPALVRVPSSDVAWTKRVLDTGAEGVILPRSYSTEEVQQFVAACRYPPMGTRGFGPRRPTNYGRLKADDYVAHANQHAFVAVQIETVEALECLDEIVKIPGIDSLVVGPYDLSGSMGMLGQVHEPPVLDAIRRIVRTAREAGLFVGIGTGADQQHAVEAAELGINWVQCGNDFEYMIRGAERLFADVRAQVEG